MEIPYTVHPRPDTGLANPKLGIWLFIASEVMLFGGLFAGYIFMRLGAEPWMWPHGWLNVPVGTFNTFILIFSSVTIILSWESLKMRKYTAYKNWLAATWICGLAFLGVKLIVEWPEKFHHFGAYIQKDALHKYEPLLGNEDPKDEKGNPVVVVEDGKPVETKGRISREKPERRFISGHLYDGYSMHLAGVPYISPKKLDDMIGSVWAIRAKKAELQATLDKPAPAGLPPEEQKKAEEARKTAKAQLEPVSNTLVSMMKLLPQYGMEQADIDNLLNEGHPPEKRAQLRAAFLQRVNTILVHAVDADNAKPYDPANDSAHFIPRDQVKIDQLKLPSNLVHEHTDEKTKEKHVNLLINKADLISGHGAFVPKLNTYLASYFMITGLHGAHVLGGCIVFFYFWLNIKGGSKLFHTNHQQLCNRIEAAGLFWHLVDLIWIFVFPLFYLL
jgi:heme/copper-type cytochrome/quinol oxidase subunit 3